MLTFSSDTALLTQTLSGILDTASPPSPLSPFTQSRRSSRKIFSQISCEGQELRRIQSEHRGENKQSIIRADWIRGSCSSSSGLLYIHHNKQTTKLWYSKSNACHLSVQWIKYFFPSRRIRWSDEYIHGWSFCIPILCKWGLLGTWWVLQHVI